ncbi:KUP/HAK/KT family potassium transporter [Bradyrhizobium frederickii]|uniref:KUP/HAK/KT family potassium transporter n=1 Tax=Bradyrhizobium frederickii TaxID=2560054 RepID=UPI003D320EE8
MSTSFYVSRRSLRITGRSEMPRWQDRLFIALACGASNAADYVRIPTGRVLEISAQGAI